MVKAPKTPAVPPPVVKTTQQMIRMEVDNIIAQHKGEPHWDHEHVCSELYDHDALGHSEDIGCRCKTCGTGGSDGFWPIPSPDRMSGGYGRPIQHMRSFRIPSIRPSLACVELRKVMSKAASPPATSSSSAWSS